MERFEGKVAVVTGGGTGMGRELARQLTAEGCHVAICDVSVENMATTKALCDGGSPDGTVLSTFVADVSDRGQMDAFATHVAAAHGTDHINLLFNNAGIGGGGSIVVDEPDEWDKMFGVCWGGVYNGTRAFLPMLLAADEGHVVNTSSVNGFWACLGPNAHTAYSAAKFAVKGFSEALIVDFRQNAPHLKVVGRHAGSHRHLDRVQLRRLLRTRPEGAARRTRRRARASGSRRWARRVGGVRRGHPPGDADARRGLPRQRPHHAPPRRRRSSSTASVPERGGSSSATTR